ncbi:MAG: hypothetical protein GY898_18455 [Proteobacteria bacterium]|nr:hypothetical protein [Pseudomonadota bacterium]
MAEGELMGSIYPYQGSRWTKPMAELAELADRFKRVRDEYRDYDPRVSPFTWEKHRAQLGRLKRELEADLVVCDACGGRGSNPSQTMWIPCFTAQDHIHESKLVFRDGRQEQHHGLTARLLLTFPFANSDGGVFTYDQVRAAAKKGPGMVARYQGALVAATLPLFTPNPVGDEPPPAPSFRPRSSHPPLGSLLLRWRSEPK